MIVTTTAYWDVISTSVQTQTAWMNITQENRMNARRLRVGRGLWGPPGSLPLQSGLSEMRRRGHRARGQSGSWVFSSTDSGRWVLPGSVSSKVRGTNSSARLEPSPYTAGGRPPVLAGLSFLSSFIQRSLSSCPRCGNCLGSWIFVHVCLFHHVTYSMWPSQTAFCHLIACT